MSTNNAPTLPGLEPPSPEMTKLERAVAIQLQHLEDEQLLDESHAILVQMLQDLAGAVGHSVSRDRRLTIAGITAVGKLIELVELLPEPSGGMAELVAELRAV